jgi:hypothetical protein
MVPALIIEESNDAAEVGRARVQQNRAMRNSQWLQAHWPSLRPQAAGKFIAVAGQEAFVADTPDAAWPLARAAHPEDDGALCQYVRPQQGPRFYANRR